MLGKTVKFNNFSKAQFDIDLSNIFLFTQICALYVFFALVVIILTIFLEEENTYNCLIILIADTNTWLNILTFLSGGVAGAIIGIFVTCVCFKR